MSGYMDEEYRTLEPEYDYNPEITHFDNKPKPIAKIKSKLKKLMAMASATVVVGGYIVSGAMLSDAYTEGSGSNTGGYGSPPMDVEVDYPAFLSIDVEFDVFSPNYLEKYDYNIELVDTPNVTILASNKPDNINYDARFTEYVETEIIDKCIMPHKPYIDAAFDRTKLIYANYTGTEQTYSADFGYDFMNSLVGFPKNLTIWTSTKNYDYELGKVDAEIGYSMKVFSTKQEADDFKSTLCIKSDGIYVQEYDGKYCVHYISGYIINFYRLKNGNTSNEGIGKPTENATIEESTGSNTGGYGDASLAVFYHYNYAKEEYADDIRYYSYIIPDLNGNIEMIWSYDDTDVAGSTDNIEYMFLRDKKAAILKYFEDNKNTEFKNYMDGKGVSSQDVSDWFDKEIWFAYKGESHKFKVISAYILISMANTTDPSAYTSDTYMKDGDLWFANGVEFSFELEKLE